MKWLLLLLVAVVGARIHPPSQNTPEWGDVGGGGCSIHGGPATQSWRAGEVAEAVAALGHRAKMSEVGSREGRTGAGILHWHQGLGGKGGGGGCGEREIRESLTGATQSGGLQLYYKDKPPLQQFRQFFQAVLPTAKAGRELVLESGDNKPNMKQTLNPH